MVVRDRKSSTNHRQKLSTGAAPQFTTTATGEGGGYQHTLGFQGISWRRSVSCNDTEASKLEETELQPQKFALSSGTAVTVSLSASRLTYMKALTEDAMGNWTMLHFERTIDSNTTTSFKFQPKHLRNVISCVSNAATTPRGNTDDQTEAECTPTAENAPPAPPGSPPVTLQPPAPLAVDEETGESSQEDAAAAAADASLLGLETVLSSSKDILRTLEGELERAVVGGDFYHAKAIADRMHLQELLSVAVNENPQRYGETSVNLDSLETMDVYVARLKIELSNAVAKYDFARAAQIHKLLLLSEDQQIDGDSSSYFSDDKHQNMTTNINYDNLLGGGGSGGEGHGCSTTDDDEEDEEGGRKLSEYHLRSGRHKQSRSKVSKKRNRKDKKKCSKGTMTTTRESGDHPQTFDDTFHDHDSGGHCWDTTPPPKQKCSPPSGMMGHYHHHHQEQQQRLQLQRKRQRSM